MGIKNLKKNLGVLNKYRVINDPEEPVEENIDDETIFIDFSKLFYTYIATSYDNGSYFEHIYNYFDYLKNKEIYLYIDMGFIYQKQRERNERYKTLKTTNFTELNNIYVNIDKYIGFDKEFNELVKILQIDSKKFNVSKVCDMSYFDIMKNLFKIRSFTNKKQIINDTIKFIKNVFKLNLIYCYNIDAEYQLAYDIIKYYEENKKIPLIITDDQDVIFLLLHNMDINFNINSISYKNDIISKNVNILTYCINKSDYSYGIRNLSIELKNEDKDMENLKEFLNKDYENIYVLLYEYIRNFKFRLIKNKKIIDISNNPELKQNIENYFKFMEKYYSLNEHDKIFEFFEEENELIEHKITNIELYSYLLFFLGK